MEEKTIIEELKNLICTNGPEVLSDSGKINGILADFFPKAEKERAAIRSALKAGAGRMFHELSLASPVNQPMMLKNIREKLSEEAWLSDQACDYVCTVFLRALGITVPEQSDNAANNARARETEEAQARAEAEAKAADVKKDPNTGKEGQSGAWICFAIFAAIFYFWRIKDDNLIKYFELYTWERSIGITDLTRWAPFVVAQGGCVAAGLLFSVVEFVKPGKTVQWLILLATLGLITASVAEVIVDPSVRIGKNPDNITIAVNILVLNLGPVFTAWAIYDTVKKS